MTGEHKDSSVARNKTIQLHKLDIRVQPYKQMASMS